MEPFGQGLIAFAHMASSATQSCSVGPPKGRKGVRRQTRASSIYEMILSSVTRSCSMSLSIVSPCWQCAMDCDFTRVRKGNSRTTTMWKLDALRTLPSFGCARDLMKMSDKRRRLVVCYQLSGFGALGRVSVSRRYFAPEEVSAQAGYFIRLSIQSQCYCGL